jgi:mono/diheme cytochrome c family protein
MNRTFAIVLSAAVVALAPARADDALKQSSEGLEFFEKRIRPLLTSACLECHGDAKQKGGLRLDSRDGWAKGGESGPALVPGDTEASLLLKAVRYRDKDIRMPPKKKLTDEQIADLEKWVKLGAPDPRTGARAVAKKGAINIEEGREHWAYQLPKKSASPAVKDAAWPRGDIDRFILATLEEKQLKPVGDADPVTLVRRIYYDLIGLPPTPEEIEAFVRESSSGNRQTAISTLVDRLLASPHFGERWGRHWLDVARYGESVTLRGFVFKEAWRFRDYVIAAFNDDLPYDRFVREQVAGDLLSSSTTSERARQLTGTTFLTMGNTVFEEQDKKQLEMDVVDEQLDVVSKAFLAQTVTCARCHDHKFDPIPTRDYYALAGILKNARQINHANVSTWVELPLPLSEADEAPHKKHEAQVAALQARIKDAKDAAAKLAANAKSTNTAAAVALAVKDLPGIVVDDAQAKLIGNWKQSQFGGRFIGEGYVYESGGPGADKTATFQPEIPKAGKYEVRLAYISNSNRATNTHVTIFSADGEKTVLVNQRDVPPIDHRFVSLGQHRFEANGQGFVIVSTEGARGGVVVADAVQFLPADSPEVAASPAPAPTATSDSAKPAKAATKLTAAEKKAAKNAAKTEDVKTLEDELKKLNDSGPKRPMVMSVKEEPTIADLRVHVRGSVHNLGDVAPRGFLQVATHGKPAQPGAKSSGRLELGNWIASRDNPLTARVMVNRAWHWLFGAGLVRTPDNFGTTGEAPSHPELLDHLAVKFMDEGWSVKRLVREMVLSRTYQQASAIPQSAIRNPQSEDPENKLLARAHRRRLDAECIRDSVLVVSGQLNLERGGPTLKPGTAADYNYKHTDTRRSVYSPVLRNALPDLFEVFDFADPSMVSGRRNTSTVAPQALLMMNHPFVMEQSKVAARRTLALPGGDAMRIESAYRLALGRTPTDAEKKLALGYVTLPADGQVLESRQLDAWAQFYQALFASMDFRYLN